MLPRLGSLPVIPLSTTAAQSKTGQPYFLIESPSPKMGRNSLLPAKF
jgi:hypothetical protein